MKRRIKIGEGLSALREEAGLNRIEAAHLTGVSINTWKAWEQGKSAIPLDRIADIRRALKRDPITAIRDQLAA